MPAPLAYRPAGRSHEQGDLPALQRGADVQQLPGGGLVVAGAREETRQAAEARE